MVIFCILIIMIETYYLCNIKYKLLSYKNFLPNVYYVLLSKAKYLH